MSFSALVHRGIRSVVGNDGDDDRERGNQQQQPYQVNTNKLSERLWDVLTRTFDLGVTAFGGPPVHFQIFHRRFVEGLGKTPWIDEQTFQEVFAVCQALPGPASTKMLFSIAQIRAGLIPAVLVFLFWSLPGASVMYGLSLGVQRIDTVLPSPVYALLSGLNAATVGLIALAAVQLARKAITDRLTRLLVVLGGCGGMCYNALWYFPVLIISAGAITVVWDTWMRGWIARLQQRRLKRKRRSSTALGNADQNANQTMESVPQPAGASEQQDGIELVQRKAEVTPSVKSTSSSSKTTVKLNISGHGIPVKVGLAMIAVFWAIFATVMVLRGTLKAPPLLFSLFNNMFLAGTIIFGGGPVVIPLLREYVVEPGWVSPRDFLLGLAIIQALPGPNFNFAVYLGALTTLSAGGSRSASTTFPGALLAFVGIFTPGLWLCIGFQSVWRALRAKPIVTSLLRGVNAAAVGLVFTAVYRLWEIGYLAESASTGISLGREPWWLVVAASTFTGVEWFKVPPPVAILTGGIAGLAWYGVVSR
ncbi:chromate ion transporter [Coprinopsis cinerea okayama7|uniref:Chromate ion transporter n=1 Tax=Coprinopsis cinerea (strain Okayama-7 / 130 / ATCC MYA-4618 / FGSC 9003) TaxID=240176 RepID=A8NWZ2_COPC7|nr:chromate ion transporter [Coprinopsis cinerea okayama7\|eukprot:XP_001837023.1 chromate ion transporter [Coprinopsis cinerea okayama7\